MSFLEQRISFSSNFASLFSVMSNSSVLFHLNICMLWPSRSNQSANFGTLNCSNENWPNCLCHFSTQSSQFSFKHPSVSWHIIPLKFSAEAVYALDKKSPSMYNFQTVGWSDDESSPNSSCHFWNHKVRVFQILHHCPVSWKITPVYFFDLNIIYFGQKQPVRVKFLDF